MADEVVGRFPVSEAADVVVVRRAATRRAGLAGFGDLAAQELGIVASELGANLVKYATDGQIVLVEVREGSRVALRVESHDRGPGIPNVDEAVGDGYSTGGSLGAGLGAVNRLMDTMQISSGPSGTHISAVRWVPAPDPLPARCPLEVGVASAPRQGEVDNGDSFVVKYWSGHLLVGVIDGLGHGEPAKRAAQAARRYVESHCEQPLESVFRGTGIACRATRGVVMALADIDWEARTLTFASIGNIEARAIDYPGRFNVMVRRGIVGLNAPEPKVCTVDWPGEAMLILHSDGLSTHWRWDEVAHLATQPAAQLAKSLLRLLARPVDDSTILVVKAAPR